MRTQRPRHQARRIRRRRRAVSWSRVGMALIVIGLVGAGAVLANNLLLGRVEGDAAPPAPPTTALPAFPDAPSTLEAPLNHLANPGFTSDLNGWVATRATFAGWVPDGRRSAGAIALRANPRITATPEDGTEPEAIGVTTQAVASAVAGDRVQASVWVRGSRPGTTVVLRLVERADGQELGAAVARLSLPLRDWRRLEVGYQVRADRSRIDLELSVTRLGEVAILVADDASVAVSPG
jgi:hypothetical protein